MHRHWEDGWERRNEVTGWELREKKGRASEGEGKKKGRSEENRELVGLGRFVKIPRTTYKLHRSIAGARLKSAKSLYVRSRRCSLLACSSLGDSPRSASRNSICRGTFCEARHGNPLNLTSS